jgi:hypothetical protein
MICTRQDVKPCPCCGTQELLDIGTVTSTTYGVQCRSCGLTMEKELPGRYPPGCDDLSDVKAFTTNLAIELWNRRLGG